MKRGVLLFFVVFLVLSFMLFSVISCKKGSGILGPGYVKPTPTATFTPDVNYSVLIHQEGTPVTGVKLDMVSDTNTTLTSTTDSNGIGSFKINKHGKWSLLVNTFDDYKSQVFIVEPLTNTFYAIDYGIPKLELNLVSGSEDIPVRPSSITYTVKYHTKFERIKTIKFDIPAGINKNIFPSQTVSKDGDEITIRIDIPKSFENYQGTGANQYCNIYAYTQGTASIQKTTISNIRTLRKNWIFNVTADYYFMTLFAFDKDNGNTCYYAGIKNVNVSNSTNLFLQGQLKIEIKEFTTYSSANNTTVYSGLSDRCMPDFTLYTCCSNFNYGCFNVLAKIKTNHDEFHAWRDNMGANGYLKVRFYDDLYFDVTRTFSTNNGWSWVYYHWCCTRDQITRASCTCKNDVSESCSFWDRFRCADITRYRYQRINITK